MYKDPLNGNMQLPPAYAQTTAKTSLKKTNYRHFHDLHFLRYENLCLIFGTEQQHSPLLFFFV